MSTFRKVSLLAAATVLVLTAVACGEEESDGGAQQQAVTIEAFDFYFEPTSFQFEPGAEVTLTLDNAGEVAHTVTVPDLDVEAEAQGGDSIENTFTMPDEVGTFDFYCKFHPDEMTGTISVGGADQPIEEDVDEDDDDVDVDVETDDDTDAGTSEEDPDY